MQREIDVIFTQAICEPTKNGKPQVIMVFQADNGRLTFYQSLVGGAMKYTVEKLQECGWTGSDPTDLSGIPAGKRVTLVVEDTEYEGKPKTELKFINAEGGVRQYRVVPADMAADLRARMATLAPPVKDPFDS